MRVSTPMRLSRLLIRHDGPRTAAIGVEKKSRLCLYRTLVAGLLSFVSIRGSWIFVDHEDACGHASALTVPPCTKCHWPS